MKKLYLGSCHCGHVRFAVSVDLAEPGKGGARCNCSVCTKTGVTGCLVAPDAFELMDGVDALAFYEWGPKVAKRYFCRECGVHCFGRGHLAEVGGDFVSVNLNCLDTLDPSLLDVVYWDGRHDNWQAGSRKTPWPIHAV
jgi:hypothetical protein